MTPLGVLAGVVGGWLVMYVCVVRPLIRDIRQMRFRGFIPDRPRGAPPEPRGDLDLREGLH